MQTFSSQLLSELETRLQTVIQENKTPIVQAEKALGVIIPILERLRQFTIKYRFSGHEEEVSFFKETKPKFSSLLLFYNHVYLLESGKPSGSHKALRVYLKKEMDALDRFFERHSDFWRYHRLCHTHLDQFYFTRRKWDGVLLADMDYFASDPRFSTTHDHLKARLMASEKMRDYLYQDLSALKDGVFQNERPLLQWTAPKVALVELLYALHTEGVFNNGKATLHEIAGFMEATFKIELGQYHRVFLEIRMRKTERVKFLRGLCEGLEKRMLDADA